MVGNDYFSEVKRMKIPFSQLNYHDVIAEDLDYTIYTQEEISMIKDAAYKRNYKDGRYISHRGCIGPDNPFVVGMPDCSTTLVYDRPNNRWLLTDGLGNGWIR